VLRWKPVRWFGESGVIRRASEGTMKRRLEQRNAAVTMEWLASVTDKATRAQPAIAKGGMGRIWYPRAAWVPELQRQLLVFPAGKPDGHRLVNRSTADVVYLEIGDRLPGDEADYPDIDMKLRLVDGKPAFLHKDGKPY